MVKLGDLKGVESIVKRLIDSKLPIRVAFSLRMIVDDMDDKLSKLEGFRIDLVKKYGATDNDGNIQVEREKMGEFTDELKELMETDVEFKPTIIPIEVFEDNDIRLSLNDLNSLINVGLIDKIE